MPGHDRSALAHSDRERFFAGGTTSTGTYVLAQHALGGRSKKPLDRSGQAARSHNHEVRAESFDSLEDLRRRRGRTPSQSTPLACPAPITPAANRRSSAVVVVVEGLHVIGGRGGGRAKQRIVDKQDRELALVSPSQHRGMAQRRPRIL